MWAIRHLPIPSPPGGLKKPTTCQKGVCRAPCLPTGKTTAFELVGLAARERTRIWTHVQREVTRRGREGTWEGHPRLEQWPPVHPSLRFL